MSERSLNLAFVGDVCLASLFRHPSPEGIAFPDWPAIQDAVGAHDLLVGNLECCLVDAHCNADAREQPMAVAAIADPFLERLAFSDLSLANNHSLDCGAEAVPVAHARLDSIGMRAFGNGMDLREAEAPAVTECNGCKIAFVAACDKTELYASHNRAGVAPLKKSRLGRRVRAAAMQADLVVVLLHADLEFCKVPGRWRQRLSRWLIDQGAHLVIQHHPHVLQGIETYHNGLIAYSLGNFIFNVHGNQYQSRHPGVHDSLVLVVDVHLADGSPHLSYRMVPLRIEDDHLPHLLVGAARADAIQRIEELSSLLLNRRAYRRAWFQRCRLEAAAHFWSLFYACRRGHPVRGARALCCVITRREERRWLLGLLSLGYL